MTRAVSERLAKSGRGLEWVRRKRRPNHTKKRKKLEKSGIEKAVTVANFCKNMNTDRRRHHHFFRVGACELRMVRRSDLGSE